MHVKRSKIYINRIFYANEQWKVEDGGSGKPSTNGTWYQSAIYDRLFVDEFFQLCDGMVFKAAQTLFTVAVKSSAGRN